MMRAKAGALMKQRIIYHLAVLGLLAMATSSPLMRPVLAQNQKTDTMREQGRAGPSAT